MSLDHIIKCIKCESDMELATVQRGDHIGKQYKRCVNKQCNHFVFEKKHVDPIEGHGKDCIKCGIGKMITKEVGKGDHIGKKYLGCNNSACKHFEFPKEPKPDIEPLPGHGETCPNCNKNKLVTRIAKTGKLAGQRFLRCEDWKECKYIKRGN
jgi:DNA topoisomerase III